MRGLDPVALVTFVLSLAVVIGILYVGVGSGPRSDTRELRSLERMVNDQQAALRALQVEIADLKSKLNAGASTTGTSTLPASTMPPASMDPPAGDSRATSQATAEAAASPSPRVHVQAGAFNQRAHAEELVSRLIAHGFKATVVEGRPYRVWIKGALERPAAQRIVAGLRAAGFESLLVP
jgi:cell division protein FtsN